MVTSHKKIARFLDIQRQLWPLSVSPSTPRSTSGILNQATKEPTVFYSLLTIILIPTITISIGILNFIITMIMIILILTLQLPLLLPKLITHLFMHTTCEVMTMKGQLDQIKITGLSELCTLYAMQPNFNVHCSRYSLRGTIQPFLTQTKGLFLLIAI